MVNPYYIPSEKRLPEELRKLQASVRDAQRPTGTEKKRTLLNLSMAVDELTLTVEEQSARSSHSVTPASMSISSSTPGLWPSTSTAMVFPEPTGGPRVATLHLSAALRRDSGTGNMSVFVEVLQDGASTWKRHNAFLVGDTASAPPSWGNPELNELIQIGVADADQANMAIKIYGHVFVGDPITVAVEDIIATLTYGARI